jgi:serine/threonine protein kinase/Tfp pilus assembly protein PilF
MKDASQKSLEELIEEARTLPPAQRLPYLHRACSDESSYASAVEQLKSRVEWFDEIEPSHEGLNITNVAGEMIGPYKTIRSLGQGGMGEVFLAERVDRQFQQQVAIKLVRAGLLSKHIQGRLRQERQILATLEHPNIARLYDGGATQDGTPYIVMEYVDGKPVDVYCDEHALTIPERLRLFQTICSAVHRAHQNLIVHRDLKPSNILVTAEGTPKLLDFGIAKILDDRQMMHTMAVTQADVRMLTPYHASPEQVRGEPITTSSDIYVLGVLLYELLTGFKPYSPKSNRLAEMERAICDEDPPLASHAISAALHIEDSGVEEIAAKRSSTIGRLRRSLAGDVDTIIAMAMRKEPSRRYSSVEQLVSDIEYHLNAMPIVARADAWSYRAAKFVRRHALVVAMSSALIALLVAFTINTYLQSERIAQERDIADTQRIRAESERERAEAVSNFLIDSFRLADPSQSRGDSITAREILDRGATRISSELRNQPALQATLLDTIGRVYLGLGQYGRAQPLVEQSLSIRRAVFGSDSLEVARSLYNLNRVYEKKGDLDKSESLALQSLEINRKLTGDSSLESAESMCRLGVIRLEKGELANAKQMFESCLSIRTQILGPDSEQLTAPLDNLAGIEQYRKHYAEAESMLRRAIDIDRASRGTDHPQYIRHLHNLAMMLHEKRDLAAAAAPYRESIDLFKKVLGPEHPETIDAMSNFGVFLIDEGRLREADTILHEVIRINTKLRGPTHAYVGSDLINLARLAMEQHELEAAETRCNEALAIFKAALPRGHRYTAIALTLLGSIRLERGNAKDAESALRESLDAWQVEYGKDSAGYAVARATLGRALALQGRLAEAEPALTESYPSIFRSPSDSKAAAASRKWIQELYQSLGRPQDAGTYLAKAEEPVKVTAKSP